MEETEIINNPDHRVWAREFCLRAAQRGFDPLSDEDMDWLGTWFANAMMNGYDRYKREEGGLGAAYLLSL